MKTKKIALVLSVFFSIFILLDLLYVATQVGVVILYILIKKDQTSLPFRKLKYSDLHLCFLDTILAVFAAVGTGIFIGAIQRPGETVLLEDQTIEYFVSLLIIAPFVEELFFRYALVNNIRKYFSHPKAILVSAIIFSIAHGLRVDSLIFALLQSTILIQYRNIAILFLSHFLTNSVVILVNFSEVTYEDISFFAIGVPVAVLRILFSARRHLGRVEKN